MTGRLTTVDEKPDTPSYPLILLPTSFALEETTKYRPHAAVDDATREIGAAIGVAITGSVLAAAYGHGIDPVAPMIPEAARAAVQDSLAAAIQVAEHAGPQASNSPNSHRTPSSTACSRHRGQSPRSCWSER
ncbi:MFS transporter [Rhodococcus sp. DMU2021]|uniref:MFS transporter n=1 Tax=Rhodococcus sp. DMU2021 TaxID=2866997 RepID=UPI002176AC04|nr:MFS transporter [Rhodococcus sp. DMU2021]